MFSRPRTPALVFAIVILLAAACAGLPATPSQPVQPAAPSGPTASVQDQLAQLAAAANGAASPTAISTKQPTSMPVVSVASPTAPRKPAKPAPTATPTRKPTRTRTPTAAPAAGSLPTIAQARLPKEARDTIRLIQQGGPFPYDKDGATFGNREGLLPKRPNGYYKEYTVITPGSRDRGARRIIAGRGGELYYTDDHYDSFKRVVP